MAFGDDLEVPLRQTEERTSIPEIIEAERSYWRAWQEVADLWVTSFWLTIAFSGFCVACGGLASLQYHCNQKGDLPFYIDAAIPNLAPAKALRRDWFAVVCQLWLCAMVMLVVICEIQEVTTHAGVGFITAIRAALMGYLASFATLCAISADRLLNIANFTSGDVRQAALVAFSGFVMAATADYLLIYHIGTTWGPSVDTGVP